MLENLFTVGTQVIILFILIAIGFICNKIKYLHDTSVKDITNFVLQVVTPCVIVNSYCRDFDPEMFKGLIITFIAALAYFIVSIILTTLLIHHKEKRTESILRSGAVFTNCGFMSLPLQEAVLGSVGVFYGATFVAVFNIILWTYGVIIMGGGIKNISVKKIIFSPGIIGTLLGMIVLFIPQKPPAIIMEPIKYLAALNTPLPMIVIGYHLANSGLSIKTKTAYYSIFHRLIVAPLLMIGMLYLFGITGEIMIACTIAASSPVAAATTMFSEKFSQDTALSAVMVSVSTVLSIITMPIIVALSTVL